MKIKDRLDIITKTAFAVLVLAITAIIMPAGQVKAAKAEDIDWDEYHYWERPAKVREECRENWAKYFDWDKLAYTDEYYTPKSSLYKVAKEYDGWAYVGCEEELKAACKDKNVKYICLIHEFYFDKNEYLYGSKHKDGTPIPKKLEGSEDKTLVIVDGGWINNAKWKEVWIFNCTWYTEKASGSNIVMYKAATTVRDTAIRGIAANINIAKKVKNVNIRFSQKAHDDLIDFIIQVDEDLNKKNSSTLKFPNDISVGANASVNIDATNILTLGTIIAGKKSKINIKGNVLWVEGSAKAKVVFTECSYLGRALIPVTVTEKSTKDEFMYLFDSSTREDLEGAENRASQSLISYQNKGGLAYYGRSRYSKGTGKRYNYINLRAGGKVYTKGYGVVLNLQDNPDITKVKIYCKNEDELPFTQISYPEPLKSEEYYKYLPAVYLNGKKADSKIVFSSSYKAMLAAFEEVGIKESDSKAEIVRKLWRWGWDYCWHGNYADYINVISYKDDRDFFSHPDFTETGADDNLIWEVFYKRITGCNVINVAMVSVLKYFDIDSYPIYDGTWNHAYSIVKLDDEKWYYVDFCPRKYGYAGLEIDASSYPYKEFPNSLWTINSSPFEFYALEDGTILDFDATLDSEDAISYEGDYKFQFEKAKEYMTTLWFQNGTSYGYGSDCEEFVSKARELGLVFGTKYIGYEPVYTCGLTSKPDENGKEPEIIGFVSHGNIQDYGEGYTAFYSVYNDSGQIVCYIDKDGNTIDFGLNPCDGNGLYEDDVIYYRKALEEIRKGNIPKPCEVDEYLEKHPEEW